jgi:hypothetical protein
MVSSPYGIINLMSIPTTAAPSKLKLGAHEIEKDYLRIQLSWNPAQSLNPSRSSFAQHSP